MAHSGKVVVVSSSGYIPERDDALLRSLMESQIELCCFVGVDANKWEDALDWLCIGSDNPNHLIVTTAHSDESVQEVIEFAEMFSTTRQYQVEVLRVL
jgi:hypothetical protein